MKSIILILFLIFTGCSSHSYQEAKIHQPHATLKFQVKDNTLSKVFNKRTVEPIEINGKAPNTFKLSHNEFKIHPGPTNIFVLSQIDGVHASTHIKFNAHSHQTYTIERTSDVENIIFRCRDASETIVSEMKTKKQPTLNQSGSFSIPLLLIGSRLLFF